jgi:hypothetical protein
VKPRTSRGAQTRVLCSRCNTSRPSPAIFHTACRLRQHFPGPRQDQPSRFRIYLSASWQLSHDLSSRPFRTSSNPSLILQCFLNSFLSKSPVRRVPTILVPETPKARGAWKDRASTPYLVRLYLDCTVAKSAIALTVGNLANVPIECDLLE